MARQQFRCEVFYAGVWNDISGRVRMADQVMISRGQQDQGDAARPATLSLTLDNRDGFALPTSPISPFYPTAGRYTPLFCYLAPGLTAGAQADVADTFARTVASGWGTATSGQTWGTTSAGGVIAGTDFSVSGGVGRHFVNGVNSYRITDVSGQSVEDFDSTHTIIAPLATGDDLESELIYRRQSILAYGTVRVVFTTGNQVRLLAYRADTGAQIGSTVTTGLTHAGTGTPLRLRVRVVGTLVQAKIWAAAGAEPAAWAVSVTDPSIVRAGPVGIRTGRAGANTNSANPTASYDNLTITWMDVRFFGEINSWDPYASESFEVASWVTGVPDTTGEAWTPIQASGILHRLNSGPEVLPYAIETYILSTGSLAAYWPLSDPAAINNTMRNLATPSRPIDLSSGEYDPQATELAPWLGPGLGAAAVSGVTSIYISGVANLPTSTTSHTVSIIMSGLTLDSQVTMLIVGADAADGISWYTAFANGTTGVLELAYNQFNPNVSGTVYSASHPTLFDGRSHQITVYMQDNGTGIDFFFYLDGAILIGTTVATRVWRPAYGVDVFSTGPVTLGHLAVWGTYEDPTTLLHRAARGYDGDTPADRFARLCTQGAVPYTVVGAAGGETMGPQLPATLVQLLGECARTAAALLYEPRSWLGLVFKQRAAFYNQAAAVTAAYAGGGIKKALPVIDTKNVVNAITISNADGTTYQAVTTAGPTGTTAIGRVPGTVDTNYAITAGLGQLAARAAWELAQGALTGARFPAFTFDLLAVPALALTAGRADIGDRFVITGIAADDVSQLILAIRETIHGHPRMITFQGVPDTLFQSGAYDAAGTRYDSATSTLATGYSSSATSFSVATTNPRELWTTTGGHFPIDIVVAGERIRVTNITGAASPQTFTVTRSINGVVKAQTSGAQVSLFTPARYAL